MAGDSPPVPREFPLLPAALILCGGRGRRMGSDKALLPFGSHTVLQQVARQLAPSVARIVLSVQADQWQSRADLFPGNVVVAGNRPVPLELVADDAPEAGPLEGLRSGLRQLAALPADAWVAVCGCDYPLVRGELLAWMAQHSEPHQQVVAVHGDQFPLPLPALYRRGLLPVVERLLAAGERSLRSVLAAVPGRFFTAAELQQVDPALASLGSANTPAELAALRASAARQSPGGA